MSKNRKKIISFVLIFCLLIGCGPFNQNTQGKSSSKPSTQPASSTSTPKPTPVPTPNSTSTVTPTSIITTIPTTSTTNTSTTSTTTIEQWKMKGYVLGNQSHNEIVTSSILMPEITEFGNNIYRMYYSYGSDSVGSYIKYAESNDTLNWTVKGIALQNSSDTNNREYQVGGPSIVKLKDGRYRMYYQANPKVVQIPKFNISSAISNYGIAFSKEGVVIDISPYDTNSIFKLAGHGSFFIAENGLYACFISAEEKTSTSPSSLYFATSTDGRSFSNYSMKYYSWHDPIVIKTSDGYWMFATYLKEKQGKAFSSDGLTWPSEMTEIKLVDSSNTHLTPDNSGVGDIGGILLPNGNIRLFTNYGKPVRDIVYFEK